MKEPHPDAGVTGLKTLFVNILVLLVLVLVFDLIAFRFLPAEYAYQFREYRRNPPPDVGGRGRYPRNYFVRHPQRGFDIGPNKQATHWVDGVSYPVWSNSIGCFDKEHERYDPYIYFAGDSFTWGYAPFASKFGTLIEARTGARILKCGVTHTGQRHQYEKFVEITQRIGVLPKALFVFFVSNDVANDYAHPHSTVIKGWQLDNVSIDRNNALVHHTDQELERKLAHHLQQQAQKKPDGWRERLAHILRRYSLSANLVVAMGTKAAAPAQTGPADAPVRSFYALPGDKDGHFWYSDNPFAQENKSALLRFRDFARQNNIQFVVVLIPQKWAGRFKPTWYQEVREFLHESDIQFVDLALRFHQKNLTENDLYWKFDGHLNPAGNRIVADILIDEFPQLFRQ